LLLTLKMLSLPLNSEHLLLYHPALKFLFLSPISFALLDFCLLFFLERKEKIYSYHLSIFINKKK
jgi:hypothetical protein